MMLATLSNLISHQYKAALFLNSSNRVLFANQFAYSLIDRAADCYLEKKTLVNSQTQQDTNYRTALKRVSDQLIPRTIFWRDKNISYPLRLDILPIIDEVFSNEEVAVAMVIIETFEPKTIRINRQFGDFYMLTPTEISTVELLVQGLSLSECADSKGRTISTIRWTLRNIFKKTATRSQKELLDVATLFC
jgi:DNA-binding CsgD family transcriptional regulator